MSAAKRSRPRPSDATSAASKRQKISSTSHAVPTKSGLHFLVDDNARANRKLEAKLTNGVLGVGTGRVDESCAILAADYEDEDDEEADSDDEDVIRPNGTAHDVNEDLSDVEDDDEDEESDEEGVELGDQQDKQLTNGHAASLDNVEEEVEEGEAELGVEDERMYDDEVDDDAKLVGEDDDEAEAAEPSFGELQQSREMQTVDVHASLSQTEPKQSSVARSNRIVAGPSNTSLTTVLTQALRTNDKALLESCFQVSDLASVRSTVERLQPQHAATLLQRLAERIYKAPGRTGNLMVWIQWTLVTHGGYLATQPRVMIQLKALGRVVRERASGLQPLLHLKGKLDLLSAQLEYRQKMQASARAVHAEEEDDEQAVEYVEGRDNDDWSEDEEDGIMDGDADLRMLDSPVIKPKVQPRTTRTGGEKPNHNPTEGIEEDVFELPNGAIQGEDDEDEEGDQMGDDEGLFDDEAEEVSEDDEDEEDNSDNEAESQPESEDDDDEEEASGDDADQGTKQRHPSTVNRRR